MKPPPDLAIALGRPWDVSNANWSPDFPTTARTTREMFLRQGGGRVDGVVALTEQVMADLVGVVGPVDVPGYEKPVTEDGFEQRVVYEVELKRPQDVPRKRFLVALAHEVFERVLRLPGKDVPKIVSALETGHAGDVQAWFADPGRQRAVAGTSWAGTLPAPTRSDFLMLVEANLTAGKANADLTRRVTYHVERDRGGQLVADLNIAYRNDGASTSVNPYYNGFLRVYVPRGARLLPRQGAIRDDGEAPEGRYRVFSSSVVVDPEGQARVHMRYSLPASVAPKSHYRLRWVRQTGTSRDGLTADAGGTVVHADPSERVVELRSTLRRNRVAEYLRSRRFIGRFF
jgi:hypothetical protein